ncbi:MAG: hypothetical protein WCV41_04555, partial [Patescibacteria group bacterium]
KEMGLELCVPEDAVRLLSFLSKKSEKNEFFPLVLIGMKEEKIHGIAQRIGIEQHGVNGELKMRDFEAGWYKSHRNDAMWAFRKKVV